ncbi:hypothetical protein P3X46_034850 [Hevea brasiliensis]|uniref:RING-type E3 ubiquitin transferase n=2 Tax=Hevea brasiliensis TaxID=3981 RepID=A0A6A6KTX1_HEVBR|nr:U-box domain-containing protein 9-like [Hevea brasiliensis]KAF2292431.1 hypothetical protein GH714_022713 [Hevea brasiliensis]KAJ9131951.1 hypothetical protein P3X46_034850 [Hevea brasiliensis]
MAKTVGVLEASSSSTSTAAVPNSTELKKELERQVNKILGEEDYSSEIIDEVLRILTSLKELKFEKSSKSLIDDNTVVPDEFKCPISKELMIDPVALVTGQTYDRSFILRWLNDGHQTCPQTQQVLSHTILTPNLLVREMISRWCNEHGIELPGPVEDVEEIVVVDADKDYLYSLLKKMSSSLSDQKEAAKELRLLTKKMPSYRALFGQCTDSILLLLKPLLTGRVDSHPDLQEDLITTIMNVSIHENNKEIVAEHPLVIPLLIESLKYGTMETRSNAAATLFTLSSLDSNKILIGKSGALKPLIDLLEEGHPLAMMDAACAIFNLCKAPENRGKAACDGAVRVILEKMMESVLIDELLAILVLLASHKKAVEEMVELGAVGCLLRIIRGGTSERNKENCAAILYLVCVDERATWKEIREEENANHTLSKLAENGTSRARRKINSILEKVQKAAHTA